MKIVVDGKKYKIRKHQEGNTTTFEYYDKNEKAWKGLKATVTSDLASELEEAHGIQVSKELEGVLIQELSLDISKRNNGALWNIGRLESKLKEAEDRISSIEKYLASPIQRETPTFDFPSQVTPTTCRKCGMVWSGTMSYYCPQTDCPVQPKITS